MCKISVIIAVYKGEKYIAEQLQSIFQQTCLPNEIIIGDDSPDDKTYQVIQGMQEQTPVSIQYIHNEKQLGVVNNFNNLLKLASGDLIFFCDQDDVWLPDKIKILCELMTNNPDCIVGFCDSYVCNKSLEFLGYTLFQKYFQSLPNNIKNSARTFPLLLRKVLAASHNMVIRNNAKQLFIPLENNFCGIEIYTDSFIAMIAAFLDRIVYTNQILTKYRRHDNNVSGMNDYDCTVKKRIAKLLNKENIKQEMDTLISYAKGVHECLNKRNLLVKHPENKKYLNGYILFLEERVFAMQKNFYQKFFYILLHLKSYGIYSNGLRTAIHDLLGCYPEQHNIDNCARSLR